MNVTPVQLAEFGVGVGYGGGQAVLSLKGDIDLVTAPELSAVLSAIVDRGHRHVVVDLADVGFLGAAGLGVFANAAVRMSTTQRELTLRSPNRITRRLLDATGIADLVRVELAAEAIEPSPLSSPSDRADVVATLARVVALPADRDVLDAALRLVVALAQATVAGADGVSVSLDRHGRLVTVAASDGTIAGMDRDQYATGEGPCIDAAREGRWVLVDALDDESRWPAFIPRARERGINSILSTPLRSSTGPAGALNIYSFAAHAFADREHELAEVFAGRASDVLADAGVGVSAEQLAARLQDALVTRETIAQAQGVLMGRESMSADEAYRSLRRSSAESSRPLREHAADVLASSNPGSSLPDGLTDREATDA